MLHFIFLSLKSMPFVEPKGSSHVSNGFLTWTVLNILPNPRNQSFLAKCDSSRIFNILSLEKGPIIPEQDVENRNFNCIL